MTKALTLIILAVAIVFGAYWLSTMTKPGPTPEIENAVVTENAEPETTLTIKGPLGLMSDAKGDYLTDTVGNTLYVNANDESANGKIAATCGAACEKSWPPYLLPADQVAPSKSNDPLLSKLNLFKRTDGRYQYALGTKPLYYSTLDKELGAVTPESGGWVIARP